MSGPISIFEDLGKLVDSSNGHSSNVEATTSVNKEEDVTTSQQVSPAPSTATSISQEEECSDSLRLTGFQKLEFPNPAICYAFYNKSVAEGHTVLHSWQVAHLEELAAAHPTALSPFKSCLVTCNGSGKDAIIITSFVIWFCLCKVRSRVIVTSSSGVQLTSQTEGYIRSFAAEVNKFHGEEFFRIRQRYIYCRLTGSEIRFFATDEAGKAEGYHPFEPTSEMAIVVNEGKSVTEEIHGALRRCTGYNYWLEVSTPGEPFGFFYKAATSWPHVRHITTYDCPHLSKSEVEADKLELGESSALFRSKHLALFTSFGGEVIIPEDVVAACFLNPPAFDCLDLPMRIGIDLAAGGDENTLCFSKGNVVKKEYAFRETDTELGADRIDHILKQNSISHDCRYIYADDGGIGKSIIDKLVRRGWSINRVQNQSAAITKALYGNRGAENWYRIKRLIEEKLIDITVCSEKTREQLSTRHYKQKAGAKIYLEDKKEAKSEGRPSPDRADALVLSFSGITVLSLTENRTIKIDARPKIRLDSMDEVYEHYENNVTFGKLNKKLLGESETRGSSRIFNSLRTAMGRSNKYSKKRVGNSKWGVED